MSPIETAVVLLATAVVCLLVLAWAQADRYVKLSRELRKERTETADALKELGLLVPLLGAAFPAWAWPGSREEDLAGDPPSKAAILRHREARLDHLKYISDEGTLDRVNAILNTER